MLVPIALQRLGQFSHQLHTIFNWEAELRFHQYQQVKEQEIIQVPRIGRTREITLLENIR